jgi:hypothetical protein
VEEQHQDHLSLLRRNSGRRTQWFARNAYCRRRLVCMATLIHDALKQLYSQHELNVSISSFWDCGWRVRVGDELNGFHAERTFSMEEFDQIGHWLLEEAEKPRSTPLAGHEPERVDRFAKSIEIEPDE